MKTAQEDFRKFLQNAQQALRQGDRLNARHWAERAVELGPDSEEAWLTLAAVASPRASINYLEQALKINPQSQPALKGMQWALERLDGEHPDATGESAVVEPKTEPRIHSMEKELSSQKMDQQVPSSKGLTQKSWSRIRWPILFLILLVICVTAAWEFWPVNAAPVLAFLNDPHSSPIIPGFLGDVVTPSETADPTATQTAMATITPTPTPTVTPIPTDTSTPTDPPAPTDTPSPTNTEILLPTSSSATSESSTGDGVRWIDVSLSKQMLYAYEGNTIVKSFLVSTGVAAFPTVTGKYHIYVKYLYTDMHGADYFLPNVPYTMYFYKSYGIHGTYWHHNFGHPMSHGCVNMYTPDAEWLYYWASVGTLVNIHY